MRYRSRRPEDEEGTTRPVGVTLICVLGVVGVFLNLYLVAQLAGTEFGLWAFFILCLSGLDVIIVWGLWRMASWAWSLALFGYLLAFAAHLLGPNPLGIVIDAAVIVYLLSVRDAFASGESRGGVDRPRRVN